MKFFSCFSRPKPATPVEHITPRPFPKSDVQFTSRKIFGTAKNTPTPEGDGVTVLRSIPAYMGSDIDYFSPFALFDHFQLPENARSNQVGFPPHPHRGISTLTYILPDSSLDQENGNGSVEHQDHKGNKGVIRSGGIQFMSAGKGIAHSEISHDERAVNGIQLWINLLKEDKFSEPEYQEYQSNELPEITKDGIKAKVIMGKALGIEAKVKTRTPVHYIHYTMEPNTVLHHSIPTHWNTFLYSLNGSSDIDGKVINKQNTVFFSQVNIENDKNDLSEKSKNDDDQGVSIFAGPNGFEFILVSGEPLTDGAEAVFGGPMIMTSEHEIDEAWDDYYAGVNGFEGVKEFKNTWKW